MLLIMLQSGKGANFRMYLSPKAAVGRQALFRSFVLMYSFSCIVSRFKNLQN